MSKPPPDYLIFTDLETTGLDTSTAGILEAAMIVVDTQHLAEVRHWSVLVDPVQYSRVGPRPHPRDLCDDTAYEMHVDSGLVDDWRNATLTTWALQVQPGLDEMINVTGLAMLVAHTIGYILGDGNEGEASLAGASVHYDRDVLRAAFHGMLERKSLDLLSHRLFDTSVFRTAMQAWGDDRIAADVMAADTSERPHRALDDCVASLRVARLARDVLGDAAPPPIGRRPVEDVDLPEGSQ